MIDYRTRLRHGKKIGELCDMMVIFALFLVLTATSIVFDIISLPHRLAAYLSGACVIFWVVSECLFRRIPCQPTQ